MTRRLRALALVPALAGCSLISEHTPPESCWFDVVNHPTGGIPATLGYYGGVAVWCPFGYVLGGLLPDPVDDTVRKAPGDGLGIVVGGVLGAPFHLVAWPFEGSDEEEREDPPAE